MTCFNIIKPIFDVKTLNLNFFLIKYMAIKTKSPRQKTCRMNIRIYSAGKIVMNISKYEYICHKIYEYEYPIIRYTLILLRVVRFQNQKYRT